MSPGGMVRGAAPDRPHVAHRIRMQFNTTSSRLSLFLYLVLRPRNPLGWFAERSLFKDQFRPQVENAMKSAR